MENQCQEPSQLEEGLNLAINEDQVNALNDLTLVGQLLTNKRILIGDFNALLTDADKKGGKASTGRRLWRVCQ